jgi:hypothetical protein
MLIPLKYSGYQAGIRLYPFGGGDGGGGEPAPPPPPPPRLPSAAPPPVFQTYGSGDRTGSLVQSGNSYRPSTLDYSKPIYDPNYADNITGYQDSSQFNQPIYQQQYQNYARPSTQFDTSLYGTQPMNSPAFNSGMSRGNINNAISNFYKTNPAGNNATASDALNFMRSSGVNREDFQAYAGKNNYSPQTPFGYQQPQQMQSPFSYQQPMQQQMQTPFSYQQQYQPQQMQQPMQRTSSGPSQAIVGRSSQMRGTPNVMRRAEGGIASLLDNDE